MTYYSNPEKKNYHQTDYVKAVEIITPKTYIVEDTNVSGYQTELFDQLINLQLDIANNITSILLISGITTPSGISKYFVKQNELTYLNLQKFQDYILTPLQVSLTNFKSKDEYYSYILNTVLPKTRLNSPDPLFTSSNTVSASHTYLTNALGWFYFLNTSNAYVGTPEAQPSSILLDLLGNQLFEKRELTLADGMKGLHEYLWRSPQLSSTYILRDYRSPTTPGQYTSGTQQLDKLKTLLSVLYSPSYSNETDVKVKEAFNDFLAGGIKLISREPAGPFWKLLKAFSFSVFDQMDHAQKLETLSDIKKCPPEYLPYLADLIGWTLFGSDPEKWRLQLLNALDIYKSVGTKKSLDLALKSVLIAGDFNIENEIEELWESYIPHLIYYSLATESSKLKSFETWTPSIAKNLGVNSYSNSSFDENIRLATDTIILDTVLKFPTSFRLGTTYFPVGSDFFTFYYRGRIYPIPPWEEYPYYVNSDVTDEMVDFIVDRLACFGVRQQFALQVGEYIKTNVLKTDDDIRFNNKWLIFTSGFNEAPNVQNLLNDISNNKIEYLPLWNGKSSHFILTLNAQDFNFVKNRLDKNSDKLIDVLGSIVGSFSPTHSIPNINLILSGSDDSINGSDAILNLIDLQTLDSENQFASGSSMSRSEISGVFLNSYKRTFNPNGLDYKRADLDNSTDRAFTASATTNLPRNALRRRNYEKIMPKNGYYDRTGFNMPISWEVSSRNETRFLPLGFVPSALKYQIISDYTNIPDVYDQCEGFKSDNIYYGVPVSNTYPCRGLPRLKTEPEPDDSIDLYLWFGDSIGTGIQPNSASALKISPYNNISSIVSGTYLFQASSPTGPKFDLVRVGINNDPLLTPPNFLASSVGPDLTFGYERWLQSGKNSYIVKFAIPDSYITTLTPSSSNFTMLQSSIFQNSSLNDWNTDNRDELYDIYKNWTGSGIDILKSTFGNTKVVVKGLFIFLGTNYASAKQSTESYEDYVSRAKFGMQRLLNGMISFLKDRGVYKGYPTIVWIKPDSRYAFFQPDYYPLIREAIDELQSEYTNLYSYDPPNTLNAFDNVHYDGSSNINLGSSLAKYYLDSKIDLVNKVSNADDYTVDRGQIPDIYTIMHYIKENVKIQNASAVLYSIFSSEIPEVQAVAEDLKSVMKWKDLIQSIANESPEPSGYSSSTPSLYYDFKFGREFHKWYNTYKDEFARHYTGSVLLDLDGPNILAHTLGSIFRNSKLNIPGINASAITIDLNDIKYIRNDVNFSAGSYTASSTSSVYVVNPEIRNATILSGVELVHTSAVSNSNFFIVYNLDKDNKRKSEPDYLYDSAYIQMRSLEGLPRIRFDLKTYLNPSSENHPIQTNFLLPENNYKINLNALASNDSGSVLGDCTLGVWIHTSSEGGNVWSFNNEGAWVQHSNNVSYETLFSQYTHILRFSRKDLTDVRNRRFNCIDSNTLNPQSNVLLSFTEADFQNFVLEFNTFNYQLQNYNTEKYEKTLINKDPYWSTYGQPHRKDQNYIVEIFMMPSQNNFDRFVLLSSINVTNSTLTQYSEIFVIATNNGAVSNDFIPTSTGIPLESVYCDDFRVKLSKEQLLGIVRYYNLIAGYYSNETAYASRNSIQTSSTFGVSGGSRVNYVISPDWASVSSNATYSLITNLIVDI